MKTIKISKEDLESLENKDKNLFKELFLKKFGKRQFNRIESIYIDSININGKSRTEYEVTLKNGDRAYFVDMECICMKNNYGEDY